MLLRVAHLEAGRLRDELLGERVGDRALHDDPPRRHADLPLMQEAAEGGSVNRVLEIRVAEHDQRVRAAELKHHPLQLAAARLRQASARLASSP